MISNFHYIYIIMILLLLIVVVIINNNNKNNIIFSTDAFNIVEINKVIFSLILIIEYYL